MSTPRNGGGPDDRPEDERGWTEPTHLGWEPPGWSLPSAEPDRPRWQVPGPAEPGPAEPRSAEPWDAPQPPEPWDATAPEAEQPRRGFLANLFGRGAGQDSVRQDAGAQTPAPPDSDAHRPDVVDTGVDPTDPLGTRSWGAAMGWSATDGSGPEDAAINQLVQTAPIRPGKDAGAGNVLRGRADGLDLVAFDVVSPLGRGWVPTHAITAAPLLGQIPGLRLSPVRIWRHGTGGMLQIPSGDPEFDTRWVLLTHEDGPQVRRLAEDPLVRQALLGSDDGDEIWAAVGFVAAIRPQPNRPLLIQHQARLLAAVTAALAARY